MGESPEKPRRGRGEDDLRIWQPEAAFKSEAALLQEQIRAEKQRHEAELRKLRKRVKNMKDQMQELKEVVDEVRRAPRAVLPIAVTPEAYKAICADADKDDVSITAILRRYLKLGAEAAGSPLANIPMYPNLKRRKDFTREVA